MYHSPMNSFGDFGREIVSMALNALFPDSSSVWGEHEEFEKATGLTVPVFREFVVTAQMILLFVQEDLSVTAKEGYRKMLQSASYGVEVFDKDKAQEERCTAVGAQLKTAITAAEMVCVCMD